ncbi:hypothetical protein K1719_027549 [Acacia pycnantha]|nr:hypothetical protein K1719_027549 [Acacia pycnantha]
MRSLEEKADETVYDEVVNGMDSEAKDNAFAEACSLDADLASSTTALAALVIGRRRKTEIDKLTEEIDDLREDESKTQEMIEGLERVRIVLGGQECGGSCGPEKGRLEAKVSRLNVLHYLQRVLLMDQEQKQERGDLREVIEKKEVDIRWFMHKLEELQSVATQRRPGLKEKINLEEAMRESEEKVRSKEWKILNLQEKVKEAENVMRLQKADEIVYDEGVNVMDSEAKGLNALKLQCLWLQDLLELLLLQLLLSMFALVNVCDFFEQSHRGRRK